ncbi:M48 metallopeptidase family protein [Chitinibacteraceae bacterium HSL-7]
MSAFARYLAPYSPELVARVEALAARDELGNWLTRRYPDLNDVQSDSALYDYVQARRTRYLKNAAPLAKVRYDNALDLVSGTLGTHTYASRVHGNRTVRKNEIRIASVFRTLPAPFLSMIVAHELAHIREKDHNKAFYQLCCHIEPDYHQLEFDLHVWLAWLEHGS